MTKIEKLIISIIVVILLGGAVLGLVVVNKINQAGGVKQILIDTGKEVKDISRQISED